MISIREISRLWSLPDETTSPDLINPLNISLATQCLGHLIPSRFLECATFTVPGAELRRGMSLKTDLLVSLDLRGLGLPEYHCSQRWVPLSCDGERFTVPASVSWYTFLAGHWPQQARWLTCHSQTQLAECRFSNAQSLSM